MKRIYSLEFKHNVIIQALETETFGTVARRFQLSSLTVSRWVREYRQGKHELLHANAAGKPPEGDLRG
ncbi:helix-turn-helix domain-containing protein [Aneurinibacillus tyrosinisolvens]|uniref:helix-turn-helix domain-containing protein n=1 Tax=Aneurinibacillus tyrosinisolvens TaxID=1443435 RepID=UPI00063F6844|nr:helix-turn-helix domain-containing protein [Aneurinibacillus tyrosinisolvens]